MERTLRFYFDYISNNAYLAWLRLPELRRRFQIQVEPVPVLFAGLLEANGQLGPAEVRPKARWMLRNTLRKAGVLGARLRPPAAHPFSPLLPLRVSSLDLLPRDRERVVTALFSATWSESLRVSDPEVVAAVLDGLDLDGASLVRSATSPELKARLRAQTDKAIERDVFGVPSFELDGEVFWGYDDLPYLEGVLLDQDTIDREDLACWEGAVVQPSSMRRRFRDELPPSWQRDAARGR